MFIRSKCACTSEGPSKRKVLKTKNYFNFWEFGLTKSSSVVCGKQYDKRKGLPKKKIMELHRKGGSKEKESPVRHPPLKAKLPNFD